MSSNEASNLRVAGLFLFLASCFPVSAVIDAFRDVPAMRGIAE
ncbi:secreted protein [Rhodopirellula europaea SH398]|uniref:Secreted protein n=1 Tax=Rhodopirellula europaea SH398 TaxID=1263868 RepID=M5SHR8_9BACT|nr:secreted protein [Rhodopirellula europaea SH398]